MNTQKQTWFSLGYALLLLHFCWWLAAAFIDKPILPSPIAVYQQFPLLIQNQLGWHLLASFLRILVGLSLSFISGALLGLAMGTSPKINRLFDPIIYLTYPIPKLALLPLVMLLFGLGEVSKVLLIIFIVFPQVVLAVRDAVKSIPPHYYEIYTCINATHWQKFKDITWPASLTALFTTSRITLGTAISVLFFTENYGTSYGMGYFIMDAWQRMDYLFMYGGIVSLSTLGLLLFSLVDSIGRRVTRWQNRRPDKK